MIRWQEFTGREAVLESYGKTYREVVEQRADTALNSAS